ncbi:MAG TPA: adenylate/guanylate cyclase domain-containing protein [Bradyrhizobium sp.]|uniref:AAA family ATPase n=1 Tax=Bradyrhizobium sp. TaxID=376 RepID=UPI002C3167C8|nr:adenylate/guanylate cyclase domain-containing protein [Bradyrhizobium sp.]HXB77130.1 adenylate/guanylate cyclase domain-containing protein [Bradyrhizobium sp.]
MDIAEWLRGLGLERYTQAFQDAEVTTEVLAELTEADLRELGLPLGPRKIVLKAIEALADPPTTDLLPEEAREEVGSKTVAISVEAGRRQLTVMFVDLVGSTALSTRLDPEEMGDLIRNYQNTVAGEITRFEGHIAKFLGDGVLAYFGWPRAHEDEAERAARAGLSLTAAVAALAAPGDGALAARVGIATGLVVVGHLVGEEEARERAVVGETPNLAARLQEVAEPGRVVVAEATRRLLGDLFAYRDLGALRLKGFAEPVRVWSILGEGAAESRFDARHASTTALVGRDQELALLLDRWERAKDSEGQVVLLAGEPGIGKSRLVHALRERLGSEPRTPLRHYCSPYHTNSAFYPVIGLLERAAGLQRGEPPERQLDTLEAMLALAVENVQESAPLFADLLAIPTGGRYRPLDLSPQHRKERIFQALLDQVAGLASRQPVLALYEDVHWIDPTTLELLGRVVDRVQRLRVLAVITFRPEFAPPWTGHGHVTTLSLSRLARRQGAAVVGRVTGGKRLPDEVLEQILAKTDGVPLFVEELTKTVLESGLLEDTGDCYELTGPLPPLAIPATLQDSLMARLDRLASVKEVAQMAACIGREFSHELLAAVASLGENALGDALAQLLTAELIFRRGAPPKVGYSFKHALVQDVAHESLLKSRRQQIHARIAAVLEERFPTVAETEPEMLAQHLTEAGLAGRAVGYWLRAGRSAAERSANLEAISHLSKGLEALNRLPACPERDRQELTLQTAIGTPLIAVHGYAAPQTGAAYSRARLLCERLGDTGALFATLSGEFTYHFVRGDYGMMRQLTEEARRTSERTADAALRLAAHRLSGLTALQVGAFVEARSEFETILRLYDPSRHRPPPVHFVHDPKISALPYLAVILWILGYPEQARCWSVAALQYAEVLNQANLTAHVRVYGGAGLAELLRDTAAVRGHADAIISLADQHRLHYFRLSGLILRGWVIAQEGATEEGLALMRQSAAERLALGVGWYQIRYLCMLAATHLQAGTAEEGLGVIAQAANLVARNNDHMWEAELRRLEGELRSAQGASPADVESCFEQALATARGQSAKSFELRASISLARLRRDQGKHAEARALLAPVYGWFTEGFDTRDLKEAKALLDELS